MAQQRLRPGPWKLVNTSGNTIEIQIDYEKFEIAGSATVDFEIKTMGLFDDTSLKIYRNPVTTFQSTSSTGAPPPPSSL